MRIVLLILTTGMIPVIAGCSLSGSGETLPPQLVVQPDRSAVCTALAPTYPLPTVSYSESQDTPVTVALAKKSNAIYRQANARYNAACK